MLTYIGNYIKSKDRYGHSCNLNFEGKPSFKTIPGGIISMAFLFAVYSYALIKTKVMLNVESWSLIKQSVLQTENELTQIERIKNYSNVTLGLQFKQKRKVMSPEIIAKLDALNSGRRRLEEEEDGPSLDE